MFTKVKWLKPHPSFAYFSGDIGYISSEWAAKLLPQGFIMLIPEEDGFLKPAPPVVPLEGGQISGSNDASVNPLPADMPGREKLFEAGYRELSKIKEAGELLMDAGISKTMCKNIQKYLKDK